MAADYTDYELYHEWLSLNRPATEEERHIGGVAASTPARILGLSADARGAGTVTAGRAPLAWVRAPVPSLRLALHDCNPCGD